jgi:hypothetical protein
MNESIRSTYFHSDDSIVIIGTKSILFKSFMDILTTTYYLNEFREKINNNSQSMQRLTNLVQLNMPVSSVVTQAFMELENDQQKLIDSVQKPLSEVCRYDSTFGNDVDRQLFEALQSLRTRLEQITRFINDDLFPTIKSWKQNGLFNKDLEARIRKYHWLVVTIIIVMMVVSVCLPSLIFMISFIQVISRRKQSESMKIRHAVHLFIISIVHR